MIPFTTCVRLMGRRREEDQPETRRIIQEVVPQSTGGDAMRRGRPSIQVDVDVHTCRASSTTPTSGPPISEQSIRALRLLRAGSSLRDDGESEGESTLTIEGRRRSSSSIRFADDTDTGTDILVITEEDLADILEDPIYGDVSSPARMYRKTSSPMTEEAYSAIPAPIAQHRRFRRGGRRSLMTSSVQKHLLLGVHGMSVGAAGAVVYPSPSSYIDPSSRPSASRLLLTLRRRKSMAQSSIHIDPSALLDFSYGPRIVDRFLHSCTAWNFSSFTLDTLTGGHSLSTLLVYLFKSYGLVDHFNLDILALWKCFHLFEQGYHDTNPYHNSVHAADVTQAMHCFLQEGAIGPYLTPMEKMSALLAAVSHDLDHPGVNQHFLIATNSHLAALYNNLSVLESHHWRFAMACMKESGVFNHFSGQNWGQMKYLVSQLILATDITQQAGYLQQFRVVLPQGINMTNDFDMRLFILKIALKCADLGNPCRAWDLSRRWSEQICSEFYRQGDFERQLGLPVTPICNRYSASMAKIQTDFFKNIVTPLFTLWDQFLSSPLSRQLITNLNFNYGQWESFLSKQRPIHRRHSMIPGEEYSTIQLTSTIPSSSSTLSGSHLPHPERSRTFSLFPTDDDDFLQQSSGLSPLHRRPSEPQPTQRPLTLPFPPPSHHEPRRRDDDDDRQDDPPPPGPTFCDGIHGCGTPSSPSLVGSPSSCSSCFTDDEDDGDNLKVIQSLSHPRHHPSPMTGTHKHPHPHPQSQPIHHAVPAVGPCSHPSFKKSNSTEEEDEECCSSPDSEEEGQGGTMGPLAPSFSHSHPHPPSLMPPQYWGRRGSAPGCIGIYASAELAALSLVLIQGLNPRRSSAPVEGNGGSNQGSK